MPEEIVINLGLECLKARKIDEAIQHLERATEMYPNSFQAFNFLGVAYAQKGLNNKAIGAFQAALHRRKDVPSVHLNLGLAFQSDGFTDKAREQFEAALSLDPNYQKAKDALKYLESSGDSTLSGQSCARHTDEPAVGTCSFCYLPVCKECKTVVDGRVYCSNCAPK